MPASLAAVPRGRRRELPSVAEFLEAVALEKYAGAYGGVTSVRAMDVEPLRRAGGSVTEARRLNTALQQWRATLSQPPPSWLLQLDEDAANRDGVYQNVTDLLAMKAVPNPSGLVRLDVGGPDIGVGAPSRSATMTAPPGRSATMMAMPRAAYSDAPGGNTRSATMVGASRHASGDTSPAGMAGKMEASLKAVARFMTPEAESAPWLLRSLDHADAVEALSNEDVGCFVVRFSARATGHFVLAYKVLMPSGRETVQNAFIRGSAHGVSLQTREPDKFPNLVALLRHYTSAAGDGTLPHLDHPLRFIKACRGYVMSLGGTTRSASVTEDSSDDFGFDSENAAETPALADQRARIESPPVSFDDIGEEHKEVDVYIAAMSATNPDLVVALSKALEKKGLSVWCKDAKMPHMRTASGWRKRAFKTEAVICQNCKIAVVMLDRDGLDALQEPFAKDKNVPFLELSLQSAECIVPILVGVVPDVNAIHFPDTFPDSEWSAWTVRKTMTSLLKSKSTDYPEEGDAPRVATFIQNALQTEKKRGSERRASKEEAAPQRLQYANFSGSLAPGKVADEAPAAAAPAKEDKPPPVPSRENRRAVATTRSDDLTWFTRKPDAQCKSLVESGPDGTFIVRESRSIGSYVLCVCDEGEAVNYLMRYEDSPRGYHFAERIFGSIPEIIFTFRATPFLAQSGHTLVLGSPPIDCIEFEGPLVSVHAQDTLSDQFWADWSIEPEQIVLRKRLGEGEFGEVWAGLLKGVGEHSGLVAKVAVKKLKDKSLHKGFLAEAKIMTELDHNNLVRIYGVSTKGSLLIIAELCQNGSLKDFLQGCFDKDELCSETTLRRFAFDVCLGMQYLEDREFVHRDLAARNVLVTADMQCKVADFGLSKQITEGEYKVDITNSKIPIRWTAPESIKRGTFTTKSDVWAYGITLYEICTHGAIPYPGKSNKEVLDAMLHENYINPMMEGMSDELYALMKMCWRQDRDHRPTFRQLAARLKKLTGAVSVRVSVSFGDDSDSDEVC